jgi:hypothetical protein
MYWELYALAARCFYMAVLPSLFPYYHPAQVPPAEATAFHSTC